MMVADIGIQVRVKHLSSSQDPTCVSEPIVLVATVDDNYVMPMTVTIGSAFKNLKSESSRISLYVIDGGIRPSTKEKAEATLKSDRLEITWLRPDPEKLKVVPQNVVIAYYYRLLMAEILPQEISKVIYLDADMVVLGDLQELWDMDMEDSFVLAATNGNSLSTAPGLSNYEQLGLDSNAAYFNAGLLVANLDKWREANLTTKFFDFFVKNQATVKEHDQDILNATLAGKWKRISSQWNQLPQFYLFPDGVKDFESLERVINHPYIIHYGGAKPWHITCDHPDVRIFEQYLDQTSWAGTRDNQWKRLQRKWQRFVRSNPRLAVLLGK
jgi:lipopolysaccharide biosynthesis glycosyltransferase